MAGTDETTEGINEELENIEEPETGDQTTQTDDEPSLRDTLNEAVAEVEEGEGTQPQGGDDKTSPPPSDEADPTTEGDVQQLDAPFDGEDGKSFKAPASWKPQERELWSKVPPQLQARIKAREAETDTLLRETADARQTHDFVNQLATGYAPLLAAEGMPDIGTGIKGMFETVALLQNGAPEMKAMKMAQLIQHYGIDINALDAALVGEQPQADPNYQVQQMIDQRLQPVNQLLDQINQTRQQQYQLSQQQADKEVAEFNGEFLQDVRLDMADFIDMAAARGQQMTLQEAYDKAISMRPDIQEILKKKQEEEAIIGRRSNIGSKMNAASSISGTRGGIASGTADTIRSAIEDAWDEAG
jgi:hypothetical protein